MNTEQQTTNTGLTLTTKSILDLDKASLTQKAMAVVDNYLDGHKSPTEGLLVAKKLIDFGELLKENLADAAANELKLAHSEKRVVFGATINEQMTGVRYDYKSTNDKEWLELNDKIKAREKFLQGIKGSITLVDEQSGEVYQVNEPTKSGKLSLIFKY